MRLSYANLTAPRAQQGGDPKYSVTLLIPKTDAATYQDIVQSIEAAAQDAQGKLWNGVRRRYCPSRSMTVTAYGKTGPPSARSAKGIGL